MTYDELFIHNDGHFNLIFDLYVKDINNSWMKLTVFCFVGHGYNQ